SDFIGRGNMNHRTKFSFVGVLAFAGAVGCGAEGDGREDIAAVQGAIGSTWATPVGIGSLQALKTMDMAGNYFLTQDIDGLNSTWVPPSTFLGTLDGRGKTIKNLIIHDLSHQAGAFFQTTQNALIKNIRFTGML